jgi:hypothetical protein
MIGLSLLWNNSVVFLPKDVNTGSFGLDFKRNRELFSEGVSAPGFGARRDGSLADPAKGTINSFRGIVKGG